MVVLSNLSREKILGKTSQYFSLMHPKEVITSNRLKKNNYVGRPSLLEEEVLKYAVTETNHEYIQLALERFSLFTKPRASNMVLFHVIFHCLFSCTIRGNSSIPKARDFTVVASQKFKYSTQKKHSQVKHHYKTV